MIKIYTDGSCLTNPGNGGWAAIINQDGEINRMSGSEKNTTNNKMEMTAAIKALEYFTNSSNIQLTTDSNYVKDGIESWIEGWKRNGWKTASKKSVKNKELWVRLDDLNNFHNISWKWVKGHSGHRENEIADLLANKGIDEL